MGERISFNRPLQFVVLSKEGAEFKRNDCKGTLMYAGKAAVKISIGCPLQAGDVLLWDDIHMPGAVHVAIVKWSQKEGDLYTGGLKLL